MSSGFYTTYLGMQARQDAMDVVANNLANASTNGFKADGAFFQSYQNALSDPTDQFNVDQSSRLEATKTDFSAGSIRQTGRELDVALPGDGFFVIQTPNGVDYTRNGSFTLNSNGQLTTEDGYLVSGQNGPITLPPGEVNIDPGGNVSVAGQNVATLRVVRFAKNDSLRKIGNNLFVQDDKQATPIPVQNPQIMQGAIEGSNVNPIKEMVTMMKYMREFESMQKMLTSMANDTNTTSMGRTNG